MLNRKQATPVYCCCERSLLGELPWDDTQDFEHAAHGFIATLDDSVIRAADGRPVWRPRRLSLPGRRNRAAQRQPQPVAAVAAGQPIITACSKSPMAFTRFVALICRL